MAVQLAYRRTERTTQPLSVQDLGGELKRMLTTPRSLYIWNLSELEIQPPFMRELFSWIRDNVNLKQTKLLVDLELNRCNTATVEDFEYVLKILKEPKLEGLVVRFGFEIFFPTLQEALKRTGMEHEFDRRIFVAQPWSYSTTGLLNELQRSNVLIERRLQLQEQKKDPTEQLRQMKAYKDTDDRLIEEAVAASVAEALDDGKCVIDQRYTFQGSNGDLDSLVSGKLGPKEVVVLVEAKHNMDTNWRMAQKEMFANLEYWEQLCNLTPADLEDNEDLCQDYVALHVESLKDKEVLLAFGGAMFSPATVQARFRFVKKPCFMINTNATGRFCVFDRVAFK